jgi:hypothetical protein
MGQKFKEDKIGALSHNAGTITLATSRLTIGGQQYTTSSLQHALGTLTANTLYMLYVVLSGGVATLVKSTNVNSVGPVGFTSWKLVGALYSSGVAVPLFGSFVNIRGVPSSDVIDYTPTGGLNNSIYVGKWQRDGKDIIASVDITFSAAPSAGTTTVSMPTNLPIDLTGLANGGNGDRQVIGVANGFDNGNANYPGRVGISSSTIVLLGFMNTAGTFGINSNGSEAIPFTIGSTDSISSKFEAPISGWSSTPLEDL